MPLFLYVKLLVVYYSYSSSSSSITFSVATAFFQPDIHMWYGDDGVGLISDSTVSLLRCVSIIILTLFQLQVVSVGDLILVSPTNRQRPTYLQESNVILSWHWCIAMSSYWFCWALRSGAEQSKKRICSMLVPVTIVPSSFSWYWCCLTNTSMVHTGQFF